MGDNPGHYSPQARLIGMGAAVTRRPCHTTVRTGPYTAVRVGYASSYRSTLEVRAIGSKHWKAPQRGLWPGPDTRGRVRCRPCCWPVAGEPPVLREPLGDGVVFSIAAT